LKETFAMSHAKQASKRKRRSKAVPALGAAGLLSLAGGASVQAAPAANMPVRMIEPGHEMLLGDEEVADVSLATFYVFDKENTTLTRPGLQLVRGGCGGGCGGCGGRGCGCGGGGGGCRCGGGCGGCRCGGGFGGCGCFVGCGGCGGCGVWWYGYGYGGGCCLSWGACRYC
jgi:hypothetical protein